MAEAVVVAMVGAGVAAMVVACAHLRPEHRRWDAVQPELGLHRA